MSSTENYKFVLIIGNDISIDDVELKRYLPIQKVRLLAMVKVVLF
jgi:hypothetical protein